MKTLRVRENQDEVWTHLIDFLNHGIVGAASSAGSAAGYGLLEANAYGVLQLVECGKRRLIQLHNPWSQGQLVNGKWTTDSPLWSENTDVAEQAQFDPRDDSTFWLEIDEFVAAFADVYACRIYDPPDWNTHRRGGAFPVEGGGSVDHPSWVLNPQFYLEVDDAKSEVVLALSQDDLDGDLNSVGLLVATYACVFYALEGDERSIAGLATIGEISKS